MKSFHIHFSSQLLLQIIHGLIELMHHILFFLPPQDTKAVKSKVKIGKLTLKILVLGNFLFFS